MMDSDHGEHHAHQDSQEMGKDHHGRSIPERIAEFVLYAIFVFGDVHFVWESHRILALVIAVAGLGCLLVLDKGFSRKTITRALAGASLIAIAIYFAVPNAPVPEIEVSGTLLPGSEPTPQNACDRFSSRIPADAVKLLVGDNALVMTKPGNFTAVQIGVCNVLAFDKTPDKINARIELYDGNGRLIATTKNGEIHAIAGENVRVRRDGDLSKLIVEDGNGNELLNVRFLNPTTIRARGIFGCPGHRAITVKDDQMITGTTIRGNCAENGAVFLKLD